MKEYAKVLLKLFSYIFILGIGVINFIQGVTGIFDMISDD